MTKDRLAEFRRRAKIYDGGTGAGDITATNAGANAAAGGHVSIEVERKYERLHTFLDQVADALSQIFGLKEDVVRVKSLHFSIITSPVPDDKKMAELDSEMDAIKGITQAIRMNLKEMEKENAKAEAEAPAKNTLYIRIRKVHCCALHRTFMDAVYQYQSEQLYYRDRCKARMKRQLQITGAECTDEDVEDIIEHKNWELFTRGLIMRKDQVKQMLSDVEARHNDIVKLEKSLRELHDLFLEMALLVERQGDTVDRIEDSVKNAQSSVEKATELLHEAEVLQTKARKKKIYIIVISIVFLLLATVIFAFVFI